MVHLKASHKISLTSSVAACSNGSLAQVIKLSFPDSALQFRLDSLPNRHLSAKRHCCSDSNNVLTTAVTISLHAAYATTATARADRTRKLPKLTSRQIVPHRGALPYLPAVGHSLHSAHHIGLEHRSRTSVSHQRFTREDYHLE